MSEKRKYTEQQEAAINARGGSVLVSAAAGSGKTSVLTERVIRLITDEENPVRADRLLIVTFTKASAAEMKQRITAALRERIRENPRSTELKHQLMLLNNADICTIDSFCSKLVRENFFELGIRRDLRIGSESELSVAKQDALDEAMEELYGENNADFSRLADALTTAKSDNGLRSTVLSVYESILSHPFPLSWLENAAEMYETKLPFKETEWGRAALSRLEEISGYIKKLSKYILDKTDERLSYYESLSSAILAASSKPKGNDKKILSFTDKLHAFRACFNDYLVFSAELSTAMSWDEITAAVSTFSPTAFSMPPKVPEGEENFKKEAASCREELSSAAGELRELFSRTEEQCREELKESGSLARGLCMAVKLYDEKFKGIKNDRGIADFSDLEHLALKLLLEEKDAGFNCTRQSREIAERYDEIIIDEYQDTNMVQDMIFTSVSKDENNLFTVGDVKQSIYRFREAMPEIFLKRRESYRLKNRENSESRSFPPIFLSGNFRSRKGIIDSVNFIFTQLMSETVGQVRYDENERLSAKASYSEASEPETEYHIVISKPNSAWQLNEARHIADIIERTVGKLQVKGRDGLRPAEYGDICILMRNLQSNIDTYADVLEGRGIPVSRSSGGNLFERSEIKLLLSFMTAVDNPQKDIPLTSLMMSAIYGFTADDMAKLRIAKRSGNIYSMLIEYAAMTEPEDAQLKEKCLAFNKEMQFYRKLSSTVPSDSFLDVFFTKSGFLSIIGAEADGEVRIKNARKLLSLARDYEKNGFRGLSGFIRMTERLKETGGTLSAGQSGSDGAVKLMTVHGSKGLEFPVCILAATASQRNTDSDTVVYHPSLGLAFKSYNRGRLLSKTTETRIIASMQKNRESISEEMRILYVALTRAKEKLYLINTLSETKTKKAGDWFRALMSKLPSDNSAEIDPYAVSSCKTLSQWIGLCALRHPSMSECLRDFGIDEIHPLPSGSTWKVEVAEGGKEAPPEESQHEAEEITIDLALAERLSRSIEAEYRYKELIALPTKVSASAISHKSGGKSFIVKTVPSFMRSGEIKGAARGTAFHEFLHYADIFSDNPDISAELERLVDKGFLSREQAAAIDLNAVRSFFDSELFARMKAADRLMREYRFAVMLPASAAELPADGEAANARIFMQGAIDCVFTENGRAVIVDYKTDRVNSVSELAAYYSKQLELYKYAFEQSEGIEVAECIIYSLYKSESFSICERL